MTLSWQRTADSTPTFDDLTLTKDAVTAAEALSPLWRATGNECQSAVLGDLLVVVYERLTHRVTVLRDLTGARPGFDVPRVQWSRVAGISCDVDDSVNGLVPGRGEHP